MDGGRFCEFDVRVVNEDNRMEEKRSGDSVAGRVAVKSCFCVGWEVWYRALVVFIGVEDLVAVGFEAFFSMSCSSGVRVGYRESV